MKSSLLLTITFCCVISLILYSCSGNSGNDENNSDRNTWGEHPYPAFSNFPTSQFKSISLGESFVKTERKIITMPITVMADEEAGYFYFPRDSTEIILPKSTILSEFKIFLKSRLYLDDIDAFRQFLSQSAIKEDSDAHFSIYYYETEKVNFKITLFYQSNFIRVHFLMTDSHT